MTEELKRKVEFVKELNKTIPQYVRNVESIRYDVFKNTNQSWYFEFLVINYVGGGKTARICTGDSFTAIFSEISKYLNQGYYSELDLYKQIETGSNIVKVSE